MLAIPTHEHAACLGCGRCAACQTCVCVPGVPASAEPKLVVEISADFAREILRFSRLYDTRGEQARADRSRLRMSLSTYGWAELTGQIVGRVELPEDGGR